jgi:hypothetical protein
VTSSANGKTFNNKAVKARTAVTAQATWNATTTSLFLLFSSNQNRKLLIKRLHVNLLPEFINCLKKNIRKWKRRTQNAQKKSLIKQFAASIWSEGLARKKPLYLIVLEEVTKKERDYSEYHVNAIKRSDRENG